MPAKFKASEKTRNRLTKQITTTHFYLKSTTVPTLLKEINGNYTKPKQKQKCLNELARRKVEIVWKEVVH